MATTMEADWALVPKREDGSDTLHDFIIATHVAYWVVTVER